MAILTVPQFLCFGCGRTSYRSDIVKNELRGRGSSKLYRDICGSKSCRGIYKVGKPYKVLGNTYYPEENKNYKEIGIASWYGDDFHYKKTANGDTFDMDSMTAAHRTLPMPSVVKVTNLENNIDAIVVVNDRGPFMDNRIIDVSRKAAKKLGFLENGTAKVKIEFLKKETQKLLEMYGFR